MLIDLSDKLAAALVAERDMHRAAMALLEEWHDTFSPCRRDGTQGAVMIDKTRALLDRWKAGGR